MTIYYYHPITESVTLSTYRTADQVGRDLSRAHIDGIIYFEAEEVLDQTIDESIWKPYVEAIEVGDIVCARSGYDSKQHFRVLGVYENRLWIRDPKTPEHPGYIVRGDVYRKVGEGDD